MVNIEESLENSIPGQDFSGDAPTSPEQILAALKQQLKELNNGDQEEQLTFDNAAREQMIQDLLKGNEPVGPLQQLLASQFFVLLTLLLIIAAIFVFFGYKLYKSLKEKQQKRDEKKKLRLQKKKK